jgi:hypothetical protein
MDTTMDKLHGCGSIAQQFPDPGSPWKRRKRPKPPIPKGSEIFYNFNTINFAYYKVKELKLTIDLYMLKEIYRGVVAEMILGNIKCCVFYTVGALHFIPVQCKLILL